MYCLIFTHCRNSGSFSSSPTELFLTSVHTSCAFHTSLIQITMCTHHHYQGSAGKAIRLMVIDYDLIEAASLHSQ